VAQAATTYRVGRQRVEVAGVLAGDADLDGVEGGWGVTTNKARVQTRHTDKA
jgi:hypothetical protein